MSTIRSITFFIPIENWENTEKIEEYFNKSLQIVNSIKLRPWTIRYVLPPIPTDINPEKCVKTIFRIYEKLPDKKIMIHPLSIESGNKCLDKIPEILSSTENLYTTILLKNEKDILNIVEKIYLKDLNPSLYTRISITHYNMVQTPYFPSTSNIKNIYGFSFALRYVDLFMNFLEGSKSKLFDFLREIEKNLGTEYKEDFLGIDYSLSPWMEESVAYLIEKTYNVIIGETGSYNAVYNLNMKIKDVIENSSVGSLGFNEVMLPVGEDDLLKERVRDGVLRLGTLEGLSTMCVVGLDMVAIMKNKDILTKIFSDMDKISKVKRKSIGTRIIPISEGETIRTNKFGEIPVIKL